MVFEDFSGASFGRLRAIRRHDVPKPTKWVCRCECGNEAIVLASALKLGKTQSCGCLRKELNSARSRSHGMSKSRLYRIWRGMLNRCFLSSVDAYPWYGGSGVTVEPQFLDFQAFATWALENGYSKDLTIDRIESSGNYGPENCRWIEMGAQALNRRNVPKRSDGVAWCSVANQSGIRTATFTNRVQRGWDFESAATTAVGSRKGT